MIEKIKEKIMQDRRIGRSSLEAFLEILKEVEAEYINKSTEHINKSSDCSSGWIPCSVCKDCEHKECEHHGKV